jgi:Flp pilus assembly protein TadB
MREDSEVDVFLIIALALALLTNLVQAFWGGSDDSSWELRYRSLDDLDQAWIAAASRTSTARPALEERDEVELAKGFRRREVRRRARAGLWAAPLLIAVTVLYLTGLVPLAVFSAVLGAYGIVAGLLDLRRGRQIKARYREVQDRCMAMTGARPTPAL